MMREKLNRVVRNLILVDFLFNSAFASISPAFAIFLTERIQGGDAQVAGFAVSVYWLVKSSLQLPIAKFLDRTDGERDDFWALIFGYLLASCSLFLYIFAATPLHIYAIQAIYGLAMSFAVPAWYGVFTRHLDRGRTSFEWSLDSVFSVGVGTALAAAVSGLVIKNFGFAALFAGAGLVGVTASIGLVSLYPYLKDNHPAEGTEYAGTVKQDTKKI